MSKHTARYVKILPVVAVTAFFAWGFHWAFGVGAANSDFADAMAAFEARNWEHAAEGFQAFAEAHSDSEFAITARLFAAISLRRATDPSGDPFLAAGEDADWGETRDLAETLLAGYRQEVANVLQDPELNDARRRRYELERLQSWELEGDFEALESEASAYATAQRDDAEKRAIGLFFLGEARARRALELKTELTTAIDAFDAVFAVDYSNVTRTKTLDVTLGMAAFWRIWCALEEHDERTAGDYVLMVEGFPESPTRDAILSRYGSLVAGI